MNNKTKMKKKKQKNQIYLNLSFKNKWTLKIPKTLPTFENNACGTHHMLSLKTGLGMQIQFFSKSQSWKSSEPTCHK
jgi:hypothetical protein